MNSISEKTWFTNREVVSIVIGVAMAVFYGSYAYFSLKQQRIVHEDDMQLIKQDMEVLEKRLDKYLSLIHI